MRERIKAALEVIAADVRTEAAWLNTLSLLEHVGARKISRTVAARHPSADVLHHLADETRHALAFKRLSEALSAGEDPGYLCGEAAGRYFRGLDRDLSAWVARLAGEEHPVASYLLVTTAIERRAMEMYPLYRAATGHAEVREELAAVVREEQSHRVIIEERCEAVLAEHGGDLAAALEVEQARFGTFWGEVERRVMPDLRVGGIEAPMPPARRGPAR
ncbi:MAG: hypothetical protein ACQEXJ_18005 [Myxococcota bacterium]